MGPKGRRQRPTAAAGRGASAARASASGIEDAAIASLEAQERAISAAPQQTLQQLHARLQASGLLDPNCRSLKPHLNTIMQFVLHKSAPLAQQLMEDGFTSVIVPVCRALARFVPGPEALNAAFAAHPLFLWLSDPLSTQDSGGEAQPQLDSATRVRYGLKLLQSGALDACCSVFAGNEDWWKFLRTRGCDGGPAGEDFPIKTAHCLLERVLGPLRFPEKMAQQAPQRPAFAAAFCSCPSLQRFVIEQLGVFGDVMLARAEAAAGLAAPAAASATGGGGASGSGRSRSGGSAAAGGGRGHLVLPPQLLAGVRNTPEHVIIAGCLGNACDSGNLALRAAAFSGLHTRDHPFEGSLIPRLLPQLLRISAASSTYFRHLHTTFPGGLAAALKSTPHGSDDPDTPEALRVCAMIACDCGQDLNAMHEGEAASGEWHAWLARHGALVLRAAVAWLQLAATAGVEGSAPGLNVLRDSNRDATKLLAQAVCRMATCRTVQPAAPSSSSSSGGSSSRSRSAGGDSAVARMQEEHAGLLAALTQPGTDLWAASECLARATAAAAMTAVKTMASNPMISNPAGRPRSYLVTTADPHAHNMLHAWEAVHVPGDALVGAVHMGLPVTSPRAATSALVTSRKLLTMVGRGDLPGDSSAWAAVGLLHADRLVWVHQRDASGGVIRGGAGRVHLRETLPEVSGDELSASRIDDVTRGRAWVRAAGCLVSWCDAPMSLLIGTMDPAPPPRWLVAAHGWQVLWRVARCHGTLPDVPADVLVVEALMYTARSLAYADACPEASVLIGDDSRGSTGSRASTGSISTSSKTPGGVGGVCSTSSGTSGDAHDLPHPWFLTDPAAWRLITAALQSPDTALLPHHLLMLHDMLACMHQDLFRGDAASSSGRNSSESRSGGSAAAGKPESTAAGGGGGSSSSGGGDGCSRGITEHQAAAARRMLHWLLPAVADTRGSSGSSGTGVQRGAPGVGAVLLRAAELLQSSQPEREDVSMMRGILMNLPVALNGLACAAAGVLLRGDKGDAAAPAAAADTARDAAAAAPMGSGAAWAPGSTSGSSAEEQLTEAISSCQSASKQLQDELSKLLQPLHDAKPQAPAAAAAAAAVDGVYAAAQPLLQRLHSCLRQLSAAPQVQAAAERAEVECGWEAALAQMPPGVHRGCFNPDCIKLSSGSGRGAPVVWHDVDMAHMRCGGCKCAVYCCVSCQRAAWPQHKRVCEQLKQIKEQQRQQAAAAGSGAVPDDKMMA